MINEKEQEDDTYMGSMQLLGALQVNLNLEHLRPPYY